MPPTTIRLRLRRRLRRCVRCTVRLVVRRAVLWFVLFLVPFGMMAGWDTVVPRPAAAQGAPPEPGKRNNYKDF